MRSATSILFLFGSASLCLGESSPVRMGGGDISGPVIQPLAETCAKGAGLELKAEFKGSLNAVKDVAENRLDLALVAVPTRTIKLPDGVESVPAGNFAVLIAVSQDNPLDSVDLTVLGGIFSTNKTKNPTIWGDVDGSKMKGDWERRPISPAIYSTQTNPVVADMFRNRVLGLPAMMRGSVRMWDDFGKLLMQAEVDPTLISVIPVTSGLKGRRLKFLALSKDANDAPVSPSAVNIELGDYPLAFPFHLVYRKADKARLAPVIRGLLDPANGEILAKANIMPLSDPSRDRALKSLE